MLLVLDTCENDYYYIEYLVLKNRKFKTITTTVLVLDTCENDYSTKSRSASTIR